MAPGKRKIKIKIQSMVSVIHAKVMSIGCAVFRVELTLIMSLARVCAHLLL